MTDQVRHKTFISYHRDDEEEVAKFIDTFDHDRDVFIARAVGSDQTMDELIESDDDDYVMRRIREDHIRDSTVHAALRWQEHVESKVCGLGACRQLAPGPQGRLA